MCSTPGLNRTARVRTSCVALGAVYSPGKDLDLGFGIVRDLANDGTTRATAEVPRRFRWFVCHGLGGGTNQVGSCLTEVKLMSWRRRKLTMPSAAVRRERCDPRGRRIPLDSVRKESR